MSKNKLAVRKAILKAGIGSTMPITIEAINKGYDPKQLNNARLNAVLDDIKAIVDAATNLPHLSLSAPIASSENG